MSVYEVSPTILQNFFVITFAPNQVNKQIPTFLLALTEFQSIPPLSTASSVLGFPQTLLSLLPPLWLLLPCFSLSHTWEADPSPPSSFPTLSPLQSHLTSLLSNDHVAETQTFLPSTFGPDWLLCYGFPRKPLPLIAHYYNPLYWFVLRNREVHEGWLSSCLSHSVLSPWV